MTHVLRGHAQVGTPRAEELHVQSVLLVLGKCEHLVDKTAAKDLGLMVATSKVPDVGWDAPGGLALRGVWLRR